MKSTIKVRDIKKLSKLVDPNVNIALVKTINSPLRKGFIYSDFKRLQKKNT